MWALIKLSMQTNTVVDAETYCSLRSPVMLGYPGIRSSRVRTPTPHMPTIPLRYIESELVAQQRMEYGGLVSGA